MKKILTVLLMAALLIGLVVSCDDVHAEVFEKSYAAKVDVKASDNGNLPVGVYYIKDADDCSAGYYKLYTDEACSTIFEVSLGFGPKHSLMVGDYNSEKITGWVYEGTSVSIPKGSYAAVLKDEKSGSTKTIELTITFPADVTFVVDMPK